MSDLLERLRRRPTMSNSYHNPDGLEAADEITRLQERLAQYEAARCIRCGCPIGAYHPADAKRITDRQEKINAEMMERLRAAGHNEQLAHGPLYLEAADEIEKLLNDLHYEWDRDFWQFAKINRLWEENVRRREAIEKHKEAMIAEKIASYYFDRELWSVLEAQK